MSGSGSPHFPSAEERLRYFGIQRSLDTAATGSQCLSANQLGVAIFKWQEGADLAAHAW
jgi:hypothetical protein